VSTPPEFPVGSTEEIPASSDVDNADPSAPETVEPAPVHEPGPIGRPAPVHEPVPAYELDTVAAAAIDLARAAAVDASADEVGDYLGAVPDGEHVVTHLFAATLAGYRGWHWAVTVARTPDSEIVTLDEVVLLPGAGALLAPAWLPWAQRVLPGDLGAGDLLPADEDDPRLVPSYTDDADEQTIELAWEFGLGRKRVLSPEGRDDATERWLLGDNGPDSPIARQAPAHCGTCGFLIHLTGALRGVFGVCANEFSSVDGRAVSVEFGCGAHSEVPSAALSISSPSGIVYDDDEIVPITL
jgi:hypothetical protein